MVDCLCNESLPASDAQSLENHGFQFFIVEKNNGVVYYSLLFINIYIVVYY